MRVLAAAFGDAGVAQGALDELRRRHGLRQDEASLAPLGDDGSSSRTVLAGRFRESDLDDVRTTIAEFGGEVVSDVDERWTRTYGYDAPDSGSSGSA